MMQYEYQIVSIREVNQGQIIVQRVNGEKIEWGNKLLIPFIEYLAEKGKEGWEVIAVFDIRESGRGHNVLLKRVLGG